jgi:hypothetical protein
VRNGAVVLLEEVPWPEGTEVVVAPIPAPPGTGAAVVAAMEAAPHVPREWVDELERRIEEGQPPPTREDPFAGWPDDAGGQ